MATVDCTPVSPATALFEREFEAALAGTSRFPQRTTFMPSSLAAPEVVARQRRHGATVVVVDEDGSEQVHKPINWERQILLAVLIVGAVYWASRGRKGGLLLA